MFNPLPLHLVSVDSWLADDVSVVLCFRRRVIADRIEIDAYTKLCSWRDFEH